MSVLRLLAVAVSAVAWSACTTGTGPDLDLAEARDRWAARGPASYAVTVTMACFCGELSNPVLVTVRNGAVESRVYVATGAPVNPQAAAFFPAVDGLFDVIESAMNKPAGSLDVDYDPVLGHPTRISIDWSSKYVDDEVTYTVAMDR